MHDQTPAALSALAHRLRTDADQFDALAARLSTPAVARWQRSPKSPQTRSLKLPTPEAGGGAVTCRPPSCAPGQMGSRTATTGSASGQLMCGDLEVLGRQSPGIVLDRGDPQWLVLAGREHDRRHPDRAPLRQTEGDRRPLPNSPYNHRSR